MVSIDYIEALLALIERYPVTTAAICGSVLTVVRFVRPVLEALRRAWVRRIDRAWPDEGTHEDRVRKTVKELARFPVPNACRKAIENSVREHKTTPPPAHPGDASE